MSNTYNLPLGATLAPRVDNSTLKFVVSDTQTIDVYGDLEVSTEEFLPRSGTLPMLGNLDAGNYGVIGARFITASEGAGGSIKIGAGGLVNNPDSGIIIDAQGQLTLYSNSETYGLYDPALKRFTIGDPFDGGFISVYIKGLINPVGPQDAATKNYVDTSIAAIPPGGTGDFLADGTIPMTGTLDMGGGDIIEVFNVSTQGNFNMFDGASGDKIIGFIGGATTLWEFLTVVRGLEPVGSADLTTKNYVDTKIAAIPPGGTGDFLADGSIPMTGTLQTASIMTGSALFDFIKEDATSFMRYDSSFDVLNHFTQVSMQAKPITELLDPVNLQDAATKNYVDTVVLPLQTKLDEAMVLITALQAKVDAL